MSIGIRVSTWISPDLVIEILLWLPVKCLLRFRSVSKSLCTEVDSSDFVKAHLKRSIESKIRLKLIIQSRTHPIYQQLPAAFYAADFDDGLGEAVILNNPFKSLHVLDTCNGLILLYRDPEIGYDNRHKVTLLSKLLLWNPFTRRYKKLLSPPISTEMWAVGCSLVHDSESDDYKVVAVSKSLIRNSCFYFFVFSLRSDSWRIFQHEFPPSIDGGHFVRDGSLFLLYQSEKGNKMLGFDIFKEQVLLEELPFVDDEPDNNQHRIRMVPSDGNIMRAVKINGDYRTLEFYLWVSDKSAKNSAAAGCWRKEFEMDGYYWSFDVLCSKKGNDDMLLVSKGKLISWYDKGRRVEESVRIQGLPDADSYKCSVSLESLVSLGNNSVYDGEEQD